MKRYSYQGLAKLKVLISQFAGILGIAFSLSAAIYLLFGISFVPKNSESITNLKDPKVTLLCFSLWFLTIGWSVSMALLNLLPTLWLSEDGIYISAYLFFKVKIPWSTIIDIGSGTPLFGYTLVRARKITIFHRIYGWLYSHTLYPSFLIGKDISGRIELIDNIEQRIVEDRRKEK